MATAPSRRRVWAEPRSSSMSPLRSSPSGRTRRSGSSGNTAERSDTSPPVSAPWSAAAGVSCAATCKPAHLHLGDEELERRRGHGDAESARESGKHRDLQ